MQINLGYWAEKCVAVDKNSGIKKYSADIFRKHIKEWQNNVIYEQSQRLDHTEFKAFMNDFRKSVRDDIMLYDADNEYTAYNAANNFQFTDSTGNSFHLNDFW